MEYTMGEKFRKNRQITMRWDNNEYELALTFHKEQSDEESVSNHVTSRLKAVKEKV